MDHLPASSIACLALTCKCFYYSDRIRRRWSLAFDPSTSLNPCPDLPHACYPGPRVSTHDYLNFISLLQRDLPGYLRCDFCQKFHPVRQTPKFRENKEDWISCPTANTKGMWLSWRYFNFHLQYEDVQMVMNRHRFGEVHGASLDSIAVNTDWQVLRRRRDTFLGMLNIEPEIIQGTLVLRTCQRLHFPKTVSKTWLFSICASNLLKVCEHEINQVRLTCEIYNLAKPQGLWSGTGPETCKQGGTHSCPLCYTHYSAAVLLHNNCSISAGMEIVLSTWTNLGSCKWSFSAPWLTASWQEDDTYSREVRMQALKTTIYKHEALEPFFQKWSETPCSSGVQHPSFAAALRELCPPPPGISLAHHVGATLKHMRKSAARHRNSRFFNPEDGNRIPDANQIQEMEASYNRAMDNTSHTIAAISKTPERDPNDDSAAQTFIDKLKRMFCFSTG